MHPSQLRQFSSCNPHINSKFSTVRNDIKFGSDLIVTYVVLAHTHAHSFQATYESHSMSK